MRSGSVKHSGCVLGCVLDWRLRQLKRVGGAVDILRFVVADGFCLAVDDTQDGATPLYVASQEGHKDAVQLLLGANAAVDQPITRGPLEKVGSANAMQHAV